MAPAHLTPEEGRAPVGAEAATLSIGELAARSGVAAATLRSWEQRFGFPAPVRTLGGQRRYDAGEVERVLRVVDARAQGLTLRAAVDSVALADPSGRSLFAHLRASHPHVEPIRVGMRVMKALTWSIEDECLAHASRPRLYGCFQDERSFRRAGRRWREVARSASSAVVFSDFAGTDPTTTPARVALPADSPMLNEWSVVCADERLSVVLAAWEQPQSSAAAPRLFEAVLSLEPAVVRDAATFCGEVATHLGLRPDGHAPDVDVVGPAEDPRRTASLLRRFATYADS